MDTESWANAMLYITICQAWAIDVVGYLVFDLLLTIWCPCKCCWMKEGGDRAWFYEEGVIYFSRLKKTVAQCRFVSDYVDNWTHKYGTKAKYCSSPVTRWTWMHLLVLGLEARQRRHDTRAVSCSQEGGCEWYTPRGFLSAKYLFYGCHFSEPVQDQSLRGLIEPRCAHFIPVKPHLKWTLLWLVSPDWILAQLNISTQTSINPNLRYVSFCHLFGCIDNEISPKHLQVTDGDNVKNLNILWKRWTATLKWQKTKKQISPSCALLPAAGKASGHRLQFITSLYCRQ